MKVRHIFLITVAIMLLAACTPSEATIQTAIAQTEAAKPTSSFTPASTDTPTVTFTLSPTFTLTSSLTPSLTPSNTITPSATATNTPIPETATAISVQKTQTQQASNKTATVDARNATSTQDAKNIAATRTQYANNIQATQDVRDKISHWKGICPKINWRELAETEYAKDHLDECVSISGKISEVNLGEHLVDIWLGNYSANLIIGTYKLNNKEGRLVEGQWITAYGHVRFGDYYRINQLTGQKTNVASIDALLIEGPGSIVWVRK